MASYSYCCYLTENLVDIYSELETTQCTYNFMRDHIMHAKSQNEFPKELHDAIYTFIDTIRHQTLDLLAKYPQVCDLCREEYYLLQSSYEVL